jgi:2-methylisocitrate lyase-like PEP mutase family enzyme
VRLCIETGVAGLSIEDNSGRKDRPLYDVDLAAERVRAAREASETVERCLLPARNVFSSV